MSDKYFDELAETALQDMSSLPRDMLKRQVKLALKEAARDTRHAAIEILNDAQAAIMNNIKYE